MPYYRVERTIQTKETVVVKAESVYQAFENASLDYHCKVVFDVEGEYEADYSSIREIPYVSTQTRLQLEEK